jgi:NAD(P)-dependent dehydrogenase (short-subunit alcohol dehydrogenase family)
MSNSKGPPEGRTWFITGATSGIGRALTELALSHRDNVVAVARNAGGLDELSSRFPNSLVSISADVRDESSVEAAVAQAIEVFGRIDVVANNAGYGLFGAVEEASDREARSIFETNVFGVLNVLRQVLPVLRAQGSGHVLQGSSLYGQSAHAGVGLLAATKYAVEGLSDALAAEVAPLGIKVTMIQPSPTATAFLANLDLAQQIDSYDDTVRAVQKTIGALPATAFSSPDKVAEAIFAVVDTDNPPLRLALGTAGAADMRAALDARIRDLDDWREVTEGVDR